MSLAVAKKFGAKRVEILEIDPDDVVLITDKDHCLYDFERADKTPPKAFLDLVRADGRIKDPIHIRYNGKDDDGQPIVHVVDGRQRVQAARLMNEEGGHKRGAPERWVLPAMPWEGTDEEAAEAVVAFNEGRVLNSLGGKIARCRLLYQRNRSHARCAIVFNVTQSTIKKWLATDDLTDEVRKKVLDQEVSLEVALPLAKLPREKQAKALEEMIESGEASGKTGKAVAKAKAARGAPEKKRKQSLAYAEVERLRQALLKAPGRKTRLQEGMIAALAAVQGDKEALALLETESTGEGGGDAE